MVVLGLQIGFSLIWLLSNVEARATFAPLALAYPSNVWEDGHVWTLVTGPLVEPGFINLLLFGFMMWGFVPRLEHFWGTGRFYRFVIFTSVAGTFAGTLVGHLIGQNAPITGMMPFMYAAIVAFGMTFQKQQIQFFAVLPLTAKQFMYGILAFLALFITLQQAWALGAAYVASIGTAVLLISKFSPALLWKKWRIRRSRAKLTVMQGGASKARPEQQKYLN